MTNNFSFKTLKKKVPWWVKFYLKIMLSRIPFDYRVWKKMSLFEHGNMTSPEYAIQVFNQHLLATGMKGCLQDKVCMELGPGDSLFSAMLMRAHHAKKIYLVDSGDYCSKDMAIYNNMLDFLESNGLGMRPVGDHFKSFDHLLEFCNAEYLTNGIFSLKNLPSKYVDFVWSQAVLEHIYADEFIDYFIELRRITKNDGISSHEIDLSDHLGNALNNLRFKKWFWESNLLRKSGFYTNRIRYNQLLDIMKQVGFEYKVLSVSKWPKLPTKKNSMVEPFWTLPDDDLIVRVLNVILK